MVQYLFQKKISWFLQLNLVSHLSLDCCSISGWVVFTEIFKVLKSVNIHSNIQAVVFTNNT